MKKPLVVGNWKMYIEDPLPAAQLAGALRRRAKSFAGVEVALAAPYPLLPAVAQALKGSSVRLAAQALAPHTAGAHTGEVSAVMLKHAGASMAIVGHSERRAAGESDADVAAQMAHAREAGLSVVLCVGERARVADGEHFAFVAAQLASALHGLAPTVASALAVAYEPVWAIGEGAQAARPEDVHEMIIFIRKILTERFGRPAAAKVPLLYGGSVEAANVPAFLHEGGVSGFLVGRASTSLESFIEILKLCKK